MSTKTRTKKTETKDVMKPFEGKTEGQRRYLRSIDENQILIGLGPAGTGKTFLAVAKAVEALLEGRVEKILLSRPTVSVGKEMGHLPGSFEEKIHPFLVPLFEELQKFINIENYVKAKKIIVEPLQFMRGRNFENAFVILDEAQNATKAELINVICRLHDSSKLIICGSLDQQDLPLKMQGGLDNISDKLYVSYLEGIVDVVELTDDDIVRSENLKLILKALKS